MMIVAESTVLVGVIKRKKDLALLLDQHWYRIPQARMPQGIYADVLAFFLSASAFKEAGGGTIPYFAQRTGVELVRRRDLLPSETRHADDIYYKVQLGPIQRKDPPIINEPKMRFSFIYTTWDRFQAAEAMRDLFSQADYFVDRVFHALRSVDLPADEAWEVYYPSLGHHIRILCENGEEVVASTQPTADPAAEIIYLNPADYLNTQQPLAYAQQIAEAVKRRGGPKMLDIPLHPE